MRNVMRMWRENSNLSLLRYVLYCYVNVMSFNISEQNSSESYTHVSCFFL